MQRTIHTDTQADTHTHTHTQRARHTNKGRTHSPWNRTGSCAGQQTNNKENTQHRNKDTNKQNKQQTNKQQRKPERKEGRKKGLNERKKHITTSKETTNHTNLRPHRDRERGVIVRTGSYLGNKRANKK